MHENTEFNTTRDVEAIQIPSGQKTTIPAGTPGVITQTLGGSYTIATYQGLARVSEQDLDALGLEKPQEKNGEKPMRAAGEPVEEKAVWDQLRQCYDPEIPVNIVDLGLIYDLAIDETAAGGRAIEVKMTLTAPGCGMGPVIAEDARQKIAALPTVEHAKVHIVWDPQWTPQMISETGRKVLGLE